MDDALDVERAAEVGRRIREHGGERRVDGQCPARRPGAPASMLSLSRTSPSEEMVEFIERLAERTS